GTAGTASGNQPHTTGCCTNAGDCRGDRARLRFAHDARPLERIALSVASAVPITAGRLLSRYVSVLAPRRRDRLWTDQVGEELRPRLQRLSFLLEVLPPVVSANDPRAGMR